MLNDYNHFDHLFLVFIHQNLTKFGTNLPLTKVNTDLTSLYLSLFTILKFLHFSAILVIEILRIECNTLRSSN